MSKRALLRLATSICLMFCVIILGQVTVFADEIKPVHEYNFDGESYTTVIDSGSQKKDGISSGTNHEIFATGYNGNGKSRYFNGTDDYLTLNGLSMNRGAKSIRFKMKKDDSTYSTENLETIINTGGNNFRGGFFIGIGSENINNRTGDRPALTSKNGTLYILYSPVENQISFEIQTPDSVCDGQWHDILFTWDGTTDINSVKLFLDDMETPVAQTTALYEETTGVTNMSVGNRGKLEGTGIKNYWYNGYLDNLQIYNTVITPEASTPITLLNLKATAGNSKVDLTWDAVDKATSYTIKRSTTAGGPYTTIASNITDTSYADTDVTSGTTYYYIVSAVNADTEISDSNEASAQPTEPQTPPATEAKLKVVLEVSEALRLSVDDDLNVNTQMSWSSSDPTVATVNEKGIVTALAPGNTVITVKSVDGSYTDYINVLVVENADDYRLAIDLKIGETARLTADDFTNTANITWAPMDSAIANVTTKGKVTALSKGLVLISAKDADGNIIGRVYVRVRE